MECLLLWQFPLRLRLLVAGSWLVPRLLTCAENARSMLGKIVGPWCGSGRVAFVMSNVHCSNLSLGKVEGFEDISNEKSEGIRPPARLAPAMAKPPRSKAAVPPAQAKAA